MGDDSLDALNYLSESSNTDLGGPPYEGGGMLETVSTNIS